ncbi:hypothetical protein DIURU_002432 [Diutina rugosa]|uniref:Membrane anchor Opy2 N-terminal domain-containing protein n=1 Tax=Diutina rugosa TaxID=5481 RepID=A0A642UV64_DIURU|nr:uncharacterized protein DIURU_002432 [Diutina rugosa]KAA8903546.1 hypothetical protein DIURU_002432 [Diutina rugosa]
MIVDYRLFSKRADGCIDESLCQKLSCEGACPDGQTCTMTTLTCDSCPQIQCSTDELTSLGSHKTPVGGIVGGVVGGVVFLAVIGVVGWLIYRYRKKHPVQFDDDEKDDDSDYCISNIDSHNGDGIASSNEIVVNSEKSSSRMTRSKRISSYESFTKPTYPGAKRSQAAQARRERQKQIVRQANAQLNPAYNDVAPSTYRNSMATTDSTSNASNILPIAYIPGVTVRPTKNNTRSIYSSESESIFSDLNTIENASIIGDVVRANNTANPAMLTQTGDATMTAIKAQPRLVNVEKIEEEEESEEEDYIPQDLADESAVVAHSSTVEEDSDSDIDSDIGEITRAASFRRPKPPMARPDSMTISSSHTDETHISLASPSIIAPGHAPLTFVSSVPLSTISHHSNTSEVALSERELVLESGAVRNRTSQQPEIALDFINFDTPRGEISSLENDYVLDTPLFRRDEDTRSPFDDPE